MTSLTSVLRSRAIVGGLSAGLLWVASDALAQTSTEPEFRPTEGGTIERSVDQGPATGSATPRTDEAIAEQNRRTEEERLRERDRYAQRDRRGETYIAGYGGGTIGSSTTGMEGRGSALGQSFADPNLANSGVYGIKIGYFHPGRLNWLGLEIEGYNSTPHLKETGSTPGTHLRLSMLGLN